MSIFSGFSVPKIIEIIIFDRIIQKIKGERFLGHGVCAKEFQ